MKEEISNIETLNLNDSGLLGIDIHSGEVRLMVDYIEDYTNSTSRVCSLVFKDCRSLSCSFNLNVAWPDSILCGHETKDGEWRNITIEMSTSASVFSVSCHHVELCRLEEGGIQ